MSRSDTALLVVDVQEKLVPHVRDHPLVTWNIRRLIDGANILSVPVIATEQYPQGLGATLTELRDRLPQEVPGKICFSCGELGELFAQLPAQGIRNLLVCGIESHVLLAGTVRFP